MRAKPSWRRWRAAGPMAFRSRSRRRPTSGENFNDRYPDVSTRDGPRWVQARGAALIDFTYRGRSRGPQMPDDRPYAARQYARHDGSDRQGRLDFEQSPPYSPARPALWRLRPMARPTTDEHGIVMLVVCASLFRQFEFVQQQWINYGLDAHAGNDTCPLVGNHSHGGAKHGPKAKFVIPSDPESGQPAIHRRGHSAIRRDSRRRIFLRAEHDRLAHDRHGRRRPHVNEPLRGIEGHDVALPNFVTVLRRAPAHDRSMGSPHFFRSPRRSCRRRASGAEGEVRGGAPGAAALQRLALRLLRAFLPNLVRVSKQLIKSYPNTGTALVTRHEDVIEVLDRNADFEVVYEPRMRAITGGENFFLGMQDTALYTRDVSNMRLAMRRDDVAAIVEPLARRLAEQLVAETAGRIDVPPDLSLPRADRDRHRLFRRHRRAG